MSLEAVVHSCDNNCGRTTTDVTGDGWHEFEVTGSPIPLVDLCPICWPIALACTIFGKPQPVAPPGP